ncbi:MAG: hypothetical protein J2P50_00975 [Hyphomicrobiaceae bacterium]|nr:hypothetical protein [Hyphomicrobiaceae bacterium]
MRPTIVHARQPGHDVAGRIAIDGLFAAFLLASLLGPPRAMAQDRSDAMVGAFQDACVPHLDDVAAWRKKIIEAGFVEPPRTQVPGLKNLDLRGKTVIFDRDGGMREVVPETQHRQRDGFELFLYVMKDPDAGMTSCAVYDFEAADPAIEKKVADWIGRPADSPASGSQHRSTWSSIAAALPGGYEEIMSEYRLSRPSVAVMEATVRSPFGQTGTWVGAGWCQDAGRALCARSQSPRMREGVEKFGPL